MTLSLVSIAPALADYSEPPGAILNHVVLVSKSADFLTWDFSKWGQLDFYTLSATFDFAFDGHGLTPGAMYTLIYYPDPFPGNGLICITPSTVADPGGNIEMHGQPGPNIGAIPIATDENSALNRLGDPDHDNTGYPGITGAKIWLVLSADITGCGTPSAHMTAFNVSQYLFELWLIQYALPATPVEHCITRNFYNLSTHLPDHVTVCWVGLPPA